MSKKQIICSSGEVGTRERIKNIYDDYQEFLIFNKRYNIAERLGYASVRQLWVDNPIVEGSSNPSDFKIYYDDFKSV